MYQSEWTMTLLVYGRRWFGRYVPFAAEGILPCCFACFWFCGDEDRVALIVSNGTVVLRFRHVIRVSLVLNNCSNSRNGNGFELDPSALNIDLSLE
ncbi:hypothetical protein CEXT_157471 [Caerostris extrusa]|uniref:Uncharacterized protein n=1 Tax=Caerostris extrusa TaxID=172846 RepID=A0AAV4UVL3_CAEEX|nr:hypothetical protein CEXT_157471 [Caerostris extrusa]